MTHLDFEKLRGPRRGVSIELVFWCVVLAGVVGLMILSRTWQRGSPRGIDHAAVGKKLPAVALSLLTGNAEDITANELAGKVTLVNFWGTWCPPCRREFPHIVELDNEFKANDGFQLVSVSMPGGETSLDELRTNTTDFLEQRGASFATYFAPEQETWRGVVKVLDGEDGVPTTIVLDRDSTIRGVWTGYLPGYENEMHELVRSLLDDAS